MKIEHIDNMGRIVDGAVFYTIEQVGDIITGKIRYRAIHNNLITFGVDRIQALVKQIEARKEPLKSG